MHRLDLLGIIGGATASWPSVSGATVPKTAADLELTRFVAAGNLWNLLPKHWLCKIMTYGKLLVRHDSWPANEWKFVLGDVHGLCCLGWPAVRNAHGFSLSPDVAALHFLIVLDLKEWKATI